MTVESPAATINDMNASYPAAGDARSEGDDHIRNIKTAIKAAFPELAGRAWRSQTKSATYIPLGTDNMTLFNCTAAITLNLTAAATLGNGWMIIVHANGGDVVIDPNAAETVNGVATLTVVNGSGAIVLCNGTSFVLIRVPVSLFVLDKGSVGVHAKIGSTKPVYIGDDASYAYITNGTTLSNGDGLRIGTDTVDLIINGSAILTTTASTVGSTGALTAVDNITMGATKQFFLDGGGNTYLQEVSADNARLVVGGTQMFTSSSTISAFSSLVGVGNAGNSTIQCYITGASSHNGVYVDGSGGTFLYSGASNVGMSGGESATHSGLFVRKGTASSRSISAAGTLNASGADYAEYELKSVGVGSIAKGQIIGFDSLGHITDRWAEAISFGVKSTDPNFVGGDVWGSPAELGLEKILKADDKPEPVYQGPVAPGEMNKDWNAEEKAAYRLAVNEYKSAMLVHEAVMIDHRLQAQAAAAERELHNTRVERRLEEARQTVDRISYSGKVPIICADAKVGDYILAVQDGEFIKAQAVSEPSFNQYLKAVGRVRRIVTKKDIEKLEARLNAVGKLQHLIEMPLIAVIVH